MRQIVWVIGVILAVSTLGHSQELNGKTAEPICEYSELYRKDGWTIPGLDKVTKKRRAAVPGRTGVYLTMLEPAKRVAILEIFRCSREHAGRLEIEHNQIGIDSLSLFDSGGRVFAYSLTYGMDSVENGRSVPIGAIWSIKFYDLDGSGRFTLRRGEKNRIVPDLVPDWVKETQQTQSK